MKTLQWTLPTAATLLLAACGGGELNVSSPESPPPHTHLNTSIDELNTISNDSSIHQVAADYQARVQDAKQMSLAEVTELLLDDQTTLKIDGKTYRGEELIKKRSFANLPTGVHAYDVQLNEPNYVSEGNRSISSGQFFIYNQPYSMIIARQIENPNSSGLPIRNMRSDTDGISTADETVLSIPRGTTFEYRGQAFTQFNDRGAVEYTVNFNGSDTTGSGKITGIQGGTIQLQQAHFHQHTGDGDRASGLEGLARNDHANGSYSLGFFGPNAEEILGAADVSSSPTIFFGGSRQ